MTDLWVLQEGDLVVDAASGAVAERVLAVHPGALHHLLLPGLVDAQVRRVDEAAQDEVREVLAEVVEGHPGVEEVTVGEERRGEERTVEEEGTECRYNVCCGMFGEAVCLKNKRSFSTSPKSSPRV